MRTTTNKRTLLVIDDDDSSRILIKVILQSFNITILESQSGQEALCIFKKHSKEVFSVLLDIHLPDYDGSELLRLFRQENPSVPIIALSAITPVELAKLSKTRGFDMYISKPFDIEHLKEVIRSYL